MVCLQALNDPYFHGLSNGEREPSTVPISKLEFEFERRKLTKDDVRELIYREVSRWSLVLFPNLWFFELSTLSYSSYYFLWFNRFSSIILICLKSISKVESRLVASCIQGYASFYLFDCVVYCLCPSLLRVSSRDWIVWAHIFWVLCITIFRF